MKRSALTTALVIAAISLPLSAAPTWADDAHHPAQGTAAQTPATPPAATSAVLSEAAIKALQEALNKQGIAVKVDGVLSEETRTAISRYQAQHHLPVTGEPDKATLDKLGVVSTQAAAPTRQPQSGQGGMMMNCPTMHGGQEMNCPMMRGQAQPGTPSQPGQTQGMGPGMKHGMGSRQMGPGQMGPGQMQPGHGQPGTK